MSPATAVVLTGVEPADLPGAVSSAEECPSTARIVVVTREGQVDDLVAAIDQAGPRVRIDLAVGETPHARVWAALEVLTGDVRAGLLDTVAFPPDWHAFHATGLLDAYVEAGHQGLRFDTPQQCVAWHRTDRR